MGVDAPRFLEGWNAPSHPRGAARQLVIRGKHRPVKCVLERNQSVYRPDSLAFNERGGEYGGSIVCGLISTICDTIVGTIRSPDPLINRFLGGFGC